MKMPSQSFALEAQNDAIENPPRPLSSSALRIPHLTFQRTSTAWRLISCGHFRSFVNEHQEEESQSLVDAAHRISIPILFGRTFLQLALVIVDEV